MRLGILKFRLFNLLAESEFQQHQVCRLLLYTSASSMEVPLFIKAVPLFIRDSASGGAGYFLLYMA